VPQFPVTSRYYGIEVAQFERPDGDTVAYLRRRLVPPPERFELLHEYTVAERDRVDNMSAQQLGDPGQYWRLCDANVAMMPEDLERVGRRIRITMPAGIPGSSGV
jgi:hypothetical protein